MATTKNYIKGLYMSARETQYGTIFNIDFTDEALEELKKLPKSSTGYRKLSAGAQKADTSKYSVYENTFIPKNNAGGNSNSSSEGDSDSLPF